MIKYIKIISACLLISFLSAGCNDFLDVNPAGTVTQDKMFRDVQGYRDAMYGIYANLAMTNLYGQNLTYGFADQLAQLFTPPRITESQDLTSYKVLQYDYTYPEIESMITNIWSDMYRVISYVNNVLENIQHADIDSHPDYRLINGEAHALRAFMHFDLMRYFCEHIELVPDAGGIPYAYTFDLKNKELFTLKECYENVLEDLTVAQNYLLNDTSQIATDYRGTVYNFVTLPAVYAMKARVFHYEGQLDSAGIYAEKVMQYSNYHLIDVPTDLPEAQKYPGGAEMIWGLSTTKLYDVLFQEFQSDPTTNFELMRPREDVEEIYKDVSWDAQNHDYRFDNFFENEERGWVFNRLLKVNRDNPDDIEEQKKNTKGICMLRLPEMYYIAAEASYVQGDQEKALKYLQAVRNSRGLTAALPSDRTNTLEKFRAELQKERRKEFWGEGQTFLDYKRTNASFGDISNNKVITLTPEIRVLPWPRNEQEFGSTNK